MYYQHLPQFSYKHHHHHYFDSKVDSELCNLLLKPYALHNIFAEQSNLVKPSNGTCSLCESASCTDF